MVRDLKCWRAIALAGVFAWSIARWEQGLGTGEVVRLRVVCLRVAGLVLGLRLSSFLLLLLAGGELGYIASLAGGVGSGKFNDPRPLLGRGYL